MSAPAKLLDAWPEARRHPQLWTCYLDGRLDELPALVASALLDPQTPEQMVYSLVERGAWEAAELLLADELFEVGRTPDEMERWRQQIERSRSAALAAWRARIAALMELGTVLQLPVETTHRPGSHRAKDEQELRRLERLVHDTLERHRGELDAADVEADLPSPAPRVRMSEPWRALVTAMVEDQALSLEHQDLRPPASDAVAWRFLDLLASPGHDGGDALLRSLGRVLGTEVHSLTRDAEGWLGRIADLSAPGFAALGRARWPDGIPIWLARAADPTPPHLAGDPLWVELRLDSRARTRPGHLVLRIEELLAVLHLDPLARRRAVLATLGAQVPLDRLFDERLVDTSVAWPRDDRWLADLGRAERPVLLSAPPGHGKSILLKTEAARRRVNVYSATDELPEEGAVLIDCEGELDARSARRLVQAIHWIKDLNPAPVVVAARPEVASVLERVREGFFTRATVPRWTHAEARHQARSMLAWGGIQADTPQRFDQIVLLCGRNPTALHYLCAALTSEMAEAGDRRRFDERALLDAWRRPRLVAQLRALFWDPLVTLPGFRPVAEALAFFGALAGRLDWRDLIEEASRGAPSAGAVEVRNVVAILQEYGVLTADEHGVQVSPGGPGRILVEGVAP